jgi:hypothetical protein
VNHNPQTTPNSRGSWLRRCGFAGTISKCLVVMLANLLLGVTTPSSGVQVYVGVADEWQESLNSPSEWSYVQQNADGFYVNFIQMGYVPGHGYDSQTNCDTIANLFTHKNAYYESDMSETQSNEQRYIDRLQAAGFTIPYTSLNYGWSATRQAGLKN